MLCLRQLEQTRASPVLRPASQQLAQRTGTRRREQPRFSALRDQPASARISDVSRATLSCVAYQLLEQLMTTQSRLEAALTVTKRIVPSPITGACVRRSEIVRLQ